MRRVADCSRLTLDVWHPNCWTLEVTEAVDAGLLSHGVYTIDGRVMGRLTAFGNESEDVDDLVAAARDSPHTIRVREFPHRWTGLSRGPVPGNATRGLFVEYDPEHSINDPLVRRGFIPDAPVRIQDGREVWTVVTREDRDEVRRRLDEVRREMDADVRLVGIAGPEAEPVNVLPTDDLSERQREVYELARDSGYYEWPRAVSAGDLAAEFDISKATLLEHLRKAEAKLLGK